MQASELITVLQQMIKTHGDIVVLDADDYPIEEVSTHPDLYGDHDDKVIKLFSEGDTH